MRHKLKDTIKIGLNKIKLSAAKMPAFLKAIDFKNKDPLRDRLQRQRKSAGN